jgi:HK97 gp10 family phage protein
MSIELRGVDQMLNDIRRRLGNASARLESKALRAAAEPMAEDMRKRVKISRRQYKESRHMQEDIRVSRVVRREGRKYVLIGPTRKTNWRAHFLEYGTSKMPAQPFIEPAFHAKKRESLMTLADEFRKGLKE